MIVKDAQQEIAAAAERAGLPGQAVVALALVESGARTHWQVGARRLPIMRPEPHVFARLLDGDGGRLQLALDLGLAGRRWRDVPVERDPAARWRRYLAMRWLNEEHAAGSCSWGWGQVMGYHARAFGFDDAVHMAAAAETVEGQTKAVLGYLAHADLIEPLISLPDRAAAERLAHGYNGAGWRQNDYAAKLVSAWHRAGATGRDTADLQRRLARLGHDPGPLDGVFGPRTEFALRAFQRAAGIAPDGVPGPVTWRHLEAAAAA